MRSTRLRFRSTWPAASLVALLAALLIPGLCVAQQITVTPQRKSAVYKVGEKIVWQVEVRPNRAPSSPPPSIS